MKRSSIPVALVALLTLVLATFQTSRAEDYPVAIGNVSVTVLDKDGKPVEGVTLRVTLPKQAQPRDPKAADSKPAENGKAAPVAEASTDRDGHVMMQKIPAGDYNLGANLKGVGTARKKITVKGAETSIVELKLIPRPVAK